MVIEQIRLPRIIVGASVGAALGVAGATVQGLFRNPMADPGIIGVSSGAAVGAVVAIAMGVTGLFFLALPAFAIITGRYAPQELIDCADLVTEMNTVKHHYHDQGIKAQQGIEL